MHRKILSASVSVQKETPMTEFQFHPGINILWGADAEDIVLTLAGVFGGMPPLNGKAEIQWDTDVSLFVSVTDGACGVEKVSAQGGSTAQLVKRFHKQRHLNFGNSKHILDGSRLPAGISSASELLLEKLRDVLAQEDDRPLFVINFLERLDEAVDLQHIFEALNATGRQVFIAVPHYYEIKTLEEMPYDTAIHTF
jgi:hypothetical protein